VTVRAWLRGRAPAAPPHLFARVDQALGRRGDRPLTEAPEQCVDAAEELLRELLARPTAGRDSALDLLAVDALMTYAFEAAASEPDALGDRADHAMTRLASLA